MVILLWATEVGLALLLVSFIVTQILVPQIRGTALFPLFRSERRAAENSLTTTRERAEVRQLYKERKSINRENN